MSLRNRKGPLSLEALSIKSFNRYILMVSRDIHNRCFSNNNRTQEAGDDVPEPEEILQMIKEYLQVTLHPALIDLLLSRLNASGRSEYEKQILLDIFMHENMVKFNPSFRVTTPSPPEFYENKIALFGNIVELNLKMAATDAILDVVGRSCPNLQVIDIVSKIGTLQKHFSRINALRLEFFVSDDGLKSLHACKKLRRVIMRKIVGSNCGGKHVTYKGIRGLLMALPNLQYIRYNNMGYVIAEVHVPIKTNIFPDGRTHFNLLQLHDDHTCVEHIDKIGALCPKLKTLCLNIPPNGTHIIQKPDAGGKCLKRLSQTQLRLSAMSLRGFPDDGNLVKYCQLKGENLRYLKFHSVTELTMTTLIGIGRHCPNIVSLDFVSATNFAPTSREVYLTHQGKYFRKLEAVTVIGLNLDLDAIFAISCHSADHLEYIQIINYGFTKHSHSALSRLMDVNYLRHLKSFICCGFEFNMDHLLRFLVRTTSLEQVAITEESSYEEYLKEVKVRHNLQYSPIIDFLPSRASCFCFDYNYS